MVDRTVIEAKRLGVICCDQSKTLGDAARRMVEEDVSALVATDPDGCLTGIITRTDMLRALVEYRDNWETLPIHELMATDVVTVAPDTTLRQVAELMLANHIHRVVAVREEDGKRHPISVVSAADIVYHMVKEL